MRYKSLFRLFVLPLLVGALALSGCSALIEPVTKVGTAPTAVVAFEMGGTDNPNVFVDEEKFLAALLPAIEKQETEKLAGWMTEPFLTGGWRADASDSAPAGAVRDLYANYLGADNQLEVVKGVDLKALMGGMDPLSLPRGEAGVIDAVLVSGWGISGRDEAILFIAREADNSLKWQGWIVIPGGFSGARLGGVQLYTNETNGYSVYLPKGYEVQESGPNNVMVIAPGEGEPGEGRAAAFIMIEPANGSSVNEITEKIKTDLGPGFNIPPGTALGLDKAMAIVLEGLPGQDVNRQMFVVYKDVLYHVMFVPDTPRAGAHYWQMEDLYAMIANTWHFTR